MHCKTIVPAAFYLPTVGPTSLYELIRVGCGPNSPYRTIIKNSDKYCSVHNNHTELHVEPWLSEELLLRSGIRTQYVQSINHRTGME
jgi:hypothetical protein